MKIIYPLTWFLNLRVYTGFKKQTPMPVCPKTAPMLNQASRNEDVWGTADSAPWILNLQCLKIHNLAALSPVKPAINFHWGWGCVVARSDMEKTKTFLPLPRIEHAFLHSTFRSLITIPSELPQLKELTLKTLSLNTIITWIYIFSPYRAVNTLRLGYKNQSVNAV